MIEPVSAAITAGKAAGAASSAAKATASGYALARRRFRLLGTFDAKWLSISEEGDSDAELSVTDVADIEAFLGSRLMEPVLAFFAISKLSSPVDQETERICNAAITNEARRWVAHSRGKWLKQLPSIISRLHEIFDGTFSHVHLPAEMNDDLEYFSTFVNAPVIVQRAIPRNANYLDRLIDRMTNLQNLVDVLALSRALASTIADVGLPPIITHTDLADMEGEGRPRADTVDFANLYVPRTFRRTGTEDTISPEQLSPTSNPFRVVIKGNPGAGKSTFVRHYKQEISSSKDAPIPVIEVSCRRYAKSTWNRSIIKYAVDTIEAEHGQRISVDDFESMLLLGRVCLVFDGLDEITDLLKRSEMVSRIESISVQYPVVSMLVTTRILGYEQATLPAALFDHLELDEFDYEQFLDYSDRWFRTRDREDLIPSFIDESETVEDLRYNPLMLSLLCALYREHGAIPTDRRDVYRQCAELLFRRWDANRKIQHDSAMPKFADSLMQEIAHLVYNSAAAQAGVEEGQLVKILAHFLRDRGYDPGRAESAAKDFVGFCAGRAWLLGSFGTNRRGKRLFSFTHRTFLEYFAAEAMTRRANNEGEVIAIIKAAYERDRTSVVPELMIQAYDFRKNNGGPLVLSEVLKTDVPSILLLRLMEGINVSSELRQRVFQRLIAQGFIEDDRGLDSSGFDLLLSLNVQAREQFIQLFLSPLTIRNNRAATLALCSAWAGKVLHGSAGRLYEVWNPPVLAAALELRNCQGWKPDAVVANWLVQEGFDPHYHWRGWDAIVCRTTYGTVSGFLWHVILQRFVMEASLPTDEIVVSAIKSAHRQLKKRESRAPESLIRDLSELLRTQDASSTLKGRQNFIKSAPWRFPKESEALDQDLREALIWILCAMRELLERSEYLGGPIENIATGFWDGDFELAIKLNSISLASDSQKAKDPELVLDDEEVDIVNRFLHSIPRWLRDWFYGNQNYLSARDR